MEFENVLLISYFLQMFATIQRCWNTNVAVRALAKS